MLKKKTLRTKKIRHIAKKLHNHKLKTPSSCPFHGKFPQLETAQVEQQQTSPNINYIKKTVDKYVQETKNKLIKDIVTLQDHLQNEVSKFNTKVHNKMKPMMGKHMKEATN
eukprot:4314210-Ditylum_brightwellii.AAC.1